MVQVETIHWHSSHGQLLHTPSSDCGCCPLGCTGRSGGAALSSNRLATVPVPYSPHPSRQIVLSSGLLPHIIAAPSPIFSQVCVHGHGSGGNPSSPPLNFLTRAKSEARHCRGIVALPPWGVLLGFLYEAHLGIEHPSSPRRFQVLGAIEVRHQEREPSSSTGT